MATPLSRALGGPDRSVSMVPCTIVQVTPLFVDLGSGAGVPAVKVDGLGYTLGAIAIAFIFEGGKPVILPIGV